MKSICVAISKYLVPLEKVDAYRPEHVEFLDACYSNGTFIVSGGQVPRVGGIIIGYCDSASAFEEILKNDPFVLNGIAEYSFTEFTPTRCTPAFQRMYDGCKEVPIIALAQEVESNL